MKTKIGDTITIRKDLKISNDPPAITSEMLRYAGENAIVVRFNIGTIDNWIRLNIDNGSWSWSEEMFEGYELKEL